jgi:hypothetical protein
MVSTRQTWGRAVVGFPRPTHPLSGLTLFLTPVFLTIKVVDVAVKALWL